MEPGQGERRAGRRQERRHPRQLPDGVSLSPSETIGASAGVYLGIKAGELVYDIPHPKLQESHWPETKETTSPSQRQPPCLWEPRCPRTVPVPTRRCCRPLAAEFGRSWAPATPPGPGARPLSQGTGILGGAAGAPVQSAAGETQSCRQR